MRRSMTGITCFLAFVVAGLVFACVPVMGEFGAGHPKTNYQQGVQVPTVDLHVIGMQEETAEEEKTLPDKEMYPGLYTKPGEWSFVDLSYTPGLHNGTLTLDVTGADKIDLYMGEDKVTTLPLTWDLAAKDPPQTPPGTLAVYAKTHSGSARDVVFTLSWDNGLTGTKHAHKSDTVKITIIEAHLKSVTFMGGAFHEVCHDDGGNAYGAPEWIDNSGPLNDSADDQGDVNNPVCYASGSPENPSYMSAQVAIKVQPGDVLADGPSYIDGYGYWCVMNDVQAEYSGQGLAWATLTSESALPANLVEWRNKQEIGWSLRLGEGASWSSGCGPSQTEVFQTLVAPQCSPPFRTVLKLACQNGGTDAASCTAATWASFSGLDVCAWNESDPTYTLKTYSRPLYYYHGGGSIPGTGDPVNDTTKLLAYADGQCNAWADLLVQTLKANGIGSASAVYLVPSSNCGQGAFFYVGNGELRGFPDPPPENPPVSFPWLYQAFRPGTGIPGQNMPAPNARYFPYHRVVKRSTSPPEYYDPSYGVSFNDLGAYTANAIGAFQNVADFPSPGRFAAPGTPPEEPTLDVSSSPPFE